MSGNSSVSGGSSMFLSSHVSSASKSKKDDSVKAESVDSETDYLTDKDTQNDLLAQLDLIFMNISSKLDEEFDTRQRTKYQKKPTE